VYVQCAPETLLPNQYITVCTFSKMKVFSSDLTIQSFIGGGGGKGGGKGGGRGGGGAPLVGVDGMGGRGKD